jgi:hypothetical protein
MTDTAQLDQLAINTIRTLSMDAVQAANSGHPGTPMALAPLVYTIWNRILKFDPRDPIWPNRDRFVLSNGHASMLLWSVLHLTATQARASSASVTRVAAYSGFSMRCGASPSNRVANRPTAKPPASKSVFINCPFDDGFKPILRAMVFTIISSDYHPRCALDATDGAEVRVSKIAKMIGECDWGIHDLSRIEPDPGAGVPARILRGGLSHNAASRAAWEVLKLSSNITKRVISLPTMVRMMAKAVSMILPVLLIRVDNPPRMTARSLFASTSCTSKLMRSIMRPESRTKSATARRPVLWPTQGSTPASPGMFQSRSELNSAATSSGDVPDPIFAKNVFAT